MINKVSTRYYSDMHEKSVCRALSEAVDEANGAYQQPSSGSGHFRKGDVICKSASLLCECKCKMSESSSVSIKKEWIEKNKEEAFTQRMDHSCIAFNFGPDSKNYYVIDENLMKFLVSRLKEFESE